MLHSRTTSTIPVFLRQFAAIPIQSSSLFQVSNNLSRDMYFPQDDSRVTVCKEVFQMLALASLLPLHSSQLVRFYVIKISVSKTIYFSGFTK